MTKQNIIDWFLENRESLKPEINELIRLHTDASPPPWKTAFGECVGENWPIGWFRLGVAEHEGIYKDFWVTTDRIHASEMNGSTAKGDAEFIARSRNMLDDLLTLARILYAVPPETLAQIAKERGQ